MPRVFLLTGRRYSLDEMTHTGDYDIIHNNNINTKDTSIKCISRTSDTFHGCPEELYNLTKLAEIAVATGEIISKRNGILNEDTESSSESLSYGYTHKLFDKSSRQPRSYFASETNSIKQLPLQQSTFDSLGNEQGDHECRDCGKTYSTSSNLARHRQTHRSLADKKARRCPHCDKLYVSMPAFSMHVRTHNQGCKCHFCGKCFSRPWLLQGHIRTHTGEKPFKCTICNKAFADKSNLRAHVQTHSNTKPHVCGRCGKAFALKSYLYKHEESSCMRMHCKNVHQQPPATINDPEKQSISKSSPTPVIVSVGKVAKNPNNSNNETSPYVVRQSVNPTQTSLNVKCQPNNVIYRSTVISPNPERIFYARLREPTAVVGKSEVTNVAHAQDQPVDFSTGKKRNLEGSDAGCFKNRSNGSFCQARAIAV